MARAHTERFPFVFALMTVVAAVVAGLAPALNAQSDAGTRQPPYRGERLVVAQEDAAQAPHQRPENAGGDHPQGAAFKGLADSRHCPGGFAVPGPTDTCTHGPDHAPRGQVQDVREIPTTAELQSAAGTPSPDGETQTERVVAESARCEALLPSGGDAQTPRQEDRKVDPRGTSQLPGTSH